MFRKGSKIMVKPFNSSNAIEAVITDLDVHNSKPVVQYESEDGYLHFAYYEQIESIIEEP